MMRASPEEAIMDRPNPGRLLDDGYEIGLMICSRLFLVGFPFTQQLLDNRLVWFGSLDESTHTHRHTWGMRSGRKMGSVKEEARWARHVCDMAIIHKRTAGQEIEGDQAC